MKPADIEAEFKSMGIPPKRGDWMHVRRIGKSILSNHDTHVVYQVESIKPFTVRPVEMVRTYGNFIDGYTTKRRKLR